jgi:hypothetical protein
MIETATQRNHADRSADQHGRAGGYYINENMWKGGAHGRTRNRGQKWEEEDTTKSTFEQVELQLKLKVTTGVNARKNKENQKVSSLQIKRGRGE